MLNPYVFAVAAGHLDDTIMESVWPRWMAECRWRPVFILMVISLADQARRLLNPSKRFVRIGNEQFAVSMDYPGEEELQQRLETMFGALGRYFEKSTGSGNLPFLCKAWGIAGTQTVEQLFTHANIALQVAKTRNTQNGMMFFHQDILRRMEEEKSRKTPYTWFWNRGIFIFSSA